MRAFVQTLDRDRKAQSLDYPVGAAPVCGADPQPELQLRAGTTDVQTFCRPKLVCPACDADDEDLASYVAEVLGEKECTLKWMTGEFLVDETGDCDCFESDPFPPADFPHKTAANRRFFHYHNIGKLLGVTGRRNRAELPDWSVVDRITELYGDKEGSPSKVGFVPGDAVAEGDA